MPKSKPRSACAKNKTKNYFDPLWSPEKKSPKKVRKRIERKLVFDSELQFEMEDLGPKGPVPKYFPTSYELARGFTSPLEGSSGSQVCYPWVFEAPAVENGAKRCAKFRRECEGLTETGAIQKWQKKIEVLNKEGQLFASPEWLAKYGDKTLEVLDTRPWHFPIKIVGKQAK